MLPALSSKIDVPDSTGRRRVLISANFDPDLPGGGNKYSTDLVRVWLMKGHSVHVLCSDYRRNINSFTAFESSGRLVIHSISEYNEIMFSHVYRQDIYDKASRIIEDIRPESIHIHNFHGLLGAVWAAVDSKFPTIYTALEFGLICMGWYLFDGTATPCLGPDIPKCKRCLKASNHISRNTRIFTKLPPAVTSLIARMAGKDPSFYKQYAYLSDYYEGVSEHLKRMVPLLPRFDAIITISKITGKTFINFGVDKEKIHYSVQGIDMPEVAATSHKTGSDEVVLIYLGHFAPIKGFDVVVKALEQLPSGLKLKVKIFGSSAKLFYSTCSRAARRYIDVEKLLINEEVEAELSTCDGLIIPSLWHENTPYAVLRTLAMGRPVVGADQAGISHLVTDGQNGLLMPPGDIKAWAEKLQYIAENPEILRNMRKNCFYRKSLEDHAAEVERVIEEVIR